MAVNLSNELQVRFQQEFLILLEKYKHLATEDSQDCSKNAAKLILWNALKVFMLTQ